MFGKPIFQCDSLTGSPICEPSAATTYSTLGGSARADFGFFSLPFSFPEPRMAVFEPKCSKNQVFGVILLPEFLFVNRRLLKKYFFYFFFVGQSKNKKNKIKIKKTFF